jgi:hypothetical protein
MAQFLVWRGGGWEDERERAWRAVNGSWRARESSVRLKESYMASVLIGH